MSGQEIPLFVQGNLGNPGYYPYSVLHASAALYLGLKQSTNLNDDEIADIFHTTAEKIQEFHKRISLNVEGSYALRGGLPASHGQHLFEGHVRCNKCGAKLDYVPCVACCSFRTEETLSDEEPLVPCNLPTNAPPGSLEAIAVMATRVEIGMTPTCDTDSLLLPECLTAKAEPTIYAVNLNATRISRGHLYDASSPTRLCKIGRCGNPRHENNRITQFARFYA